ncbi:hypothetical protein NIES37_62070 [Tolypothrix tenuis PCC 7101]|uniref:Peptidase n=1 Tax=Tolypothrix tenuis PCC 7101 TaxID=231146 RepID=A0A1Z4N8Z8_9CYAN|nr:peptidase [Aulosira sp. FACHB-113]BAZ02196.1 hypothetical protein NIES37_62070 [Tolypothrix tenuis PCC 7101]BAZ73883.1 hypothetical protein NIES50_24500 [Aulosira laxa NIES-50]
MNRLFRKYHRWLAIICVLPLLLTTITGITFPIAKAMHQRELAGFLIHLHTLETFGLDGVFPIINGIGLLGLLITGIYMTSLFRERRVPSKPLDF